MLFITAFLVYLAFVGTDGQCSCDGGFGALARALGSSSGQSEAKGLVDTLLDFPGKTDGCGCGCGSGCGCCGGCGSGCGCGCGSACSQGCGCGGGCSSCAGGCGLCNNYGYYVTKCEPPPPECAAFPVATISQTPMISPMCFTKAACETRKLLAYIERLARGAQCTRVCKAMDNLMNYAQIYSLLFGRNVNRFQGGRAACARSVLRINEAIMSTISNMARISKTLDYQMRIAGGCVGCEDASTLITKTVQAYVRLLGVLMSKVTNYLCSASKIMANDQVLRSADDIALMFLQLAPATADFLKSPCRCSEAAYRASVTAFKKDLEKLGDITKSFEDSSTLALKTSLAMVEHNVIVLTYESKLNTTDNYGGYRRMDIENTDFAHETASVFKDKNELLGSIVDSFERQTERKANKETLRDQLTYIIQMDVQLFEVTTKVISAGNCAGKLALDLHLITQKALSMLSKEMRKSGVISEAMLNNLLNLVRLTEEFAVRDLDLARFDSPEDVQADTGVKMLQESLSKINNDAISSVGEQTALAEILKEIVETPSCSKRCMPKGQFSNFRPLVRAMTSAAQKMSNIYGMTLDGDSLAAINSAKSDMIKAMKTAWDILYRRRIRSCANHDCFVIQFSKQMFEVIQVLMNSFIDPSKAIEKAKLIAAKNVIAAEKELLIVLTSMPHQLKSDDTAAIEGVNQAFQRMLYNPSVYKESSKQKFQSIQNKVAAINSECHSALNNLLTAMLAVANAL